MTDETTMVAVRAHGPGELRVDRVPVPVVEAGSGDVLLRVLAAGVCATDRKIVSRGSAGGAPLVLGHEIVAEVIDGVVGRGAAPGGVVDEVSSGVAPRRTVDLALRGVSPRRLADVASGGAARRRVVVAPNVGCGACWHCHRGSPNYCAQNRALGIHLDGGMAEYLLVPQRAVAAGHLLDIPASLSDVDAALAEPLACCVESLDYCRFAPGESLLIVGGGVMGRLHVALAKALGAGPIALVDRHEQRLQHARLLGADVTVLADRSDLESALGAALAAVASGVGTGDGVGGGADGSGTDGGTDGGSATGYSAGASQVDGTPVGGQRDGFDVIVVTVGQAATVEAAQHHLATAGRLNVFGGLPASEPELTLDGNTLHYRNQAILGTTGASMTSLARAVELLSSGAVNTAGLVSATYPLDRALAAFEDAGAVEHARVVLVNA